MEGSLVIVSLMLICYVSGHPLNSTRDSLDVDEMKLSNLGESMLLDEMVEPESDSDIGFHITSRLYRPKRKLQDNGIRNVKYRWPKKTVVYSFRRGNFNKQQIKEILKSMRTIESVSCVKFREKTRRDIHYVSIKGGSRCYASIGFQRRIQSLELGPRCITQGIIVHELVHVLGFHHMHKSPDRDTYVKILWQNVEKGEEFNFRKLSKSETNSFGIPYDYYSIMHYGRKDFSRNGKPTIDSKKKNVKIPLDNTKLSRSDIIKLNRMYKCRRYDSI